MNLNSTRYLHKLEGSKDDKLRILDHIPHSADRVLDVGCADGKLTMAMAECMPQTHFVGMDIDPVFISRAQSNTSPNCGFTHMYLRDMLRFDAKFDAVIFASVLHEFYSYGQGITSVIKALADAVEMLKPGGKLIIRDMFPGTDVAMSVFRGLQEKVYHYTAASFDRIERHTWFELEYGKTDRLKNMNHYMLKEMYVDNWQHEMNENYFPVSIGQYNMLAKLMGLREVVSKKYLLPYIEDYFKSKYKLAQEEVDVLYSTGLLVYEKGDS